MRDFQGAAGRKACDNESHFLWITGKWCSSIGAVTVLNQSLSNCWGWKGFLGHTALAMLPSSLSLQTWRSLFLSLSFPLSLNACERALPLCAAVVHNCSSWMLWWESLPWEQPTFGGCDVGRDQVPKCRDVHLDPSFLISHRVPVQGNSRVC